MRLLIDNLDGRGAMDYSNAMSSDGPGVITRRLNAPSLFRVTLLLAGTGLSVPTRRARVIVSADDTTVLFTGFSPTEPERVSVGWSTLGEDALWQVHAESDEWLLDQQGAGATATGFGLSGDALLRTLTERTDPQGFAVSSTGTIRSLGLFSPQRGNVWSENAAVIARGAYAAYRVVGGAVSLLPGGASGHAIADDDGELAPGALRLRSARSLANDVTISGEREPGAYVTEIFTGDGTTAEFVLSAVPFRPTGASAAPAFSDSFAMTGKLNAGVWTVSDPGSHLQAGAAGLTLSGGTGVDGQTTLTLTDALELGGSVVLETAGVRLNATSDGVLCGVYSGPVQRGNCLAGFDVAPGAGATVVRALINGSDAGTPVTLASGHVYTLRLRLHCVEMHRVLQTFYTMVDGVVRSFGGGALPATVHVVLELVDLGVSSNTPATVLFDGILPDAAAVIASFVPINSVQLLGSISSVHMTRGGPIRLTSTSTAGGSTTRLLGRAGEGVDAQLSGDRLTFVPGRIPAAGEVLQVTYRTTQRAVARLQDGGSVAAEVATGLPGSSHWMGHATEPVARNSVDCAAAAKALLSVATSRTAAMDGEFNAENPSDLWPGDLLRIERDGATLAMMVRSVEVQDQSALPEALLYRAKLANDWAEPLALRVARGVAADVVLPVDVTPAPQARPASLGGMTVVQVSGSSIQLDMGEAPPAGGGFEVRRRDDAFGLGQDPDLVVRSPVRGFSIPRGAQVEQFFVRAYDASAAPVYSAVSAAVITHVPVA